MSNTYASLADDQSLGRDSSLVKTYVLDPIFVGQVNMVVLLS